MTDTPELDRAIVAADRVINEDDRTYARALVAELLRGMEKDSDDPAAAYPAITYRIGYNNALRDARRRVGIVEGEG